MALTLLDASKEKTDDYAGGVIETFVLASDILKILPLETLGTMEKMRRRSNSISQIGWRKRGQAPGTITGGTRDSVTEAVFHMAGAVDIDKTEMRDKRIRGNLLKDRTDDAIKAAVFEFNDKFVNGDHATNEDTIEGIKVRLATLAAAQLIYGNTSAAELEARPGTATTANGQALFDKLDEAQDQLDGGRADVCITTRKNIRAIKSAQRRMGINKDQDSLDPNTNVAQRRTSATPWQAPLWTYNNVPYIDLGYKYDQSTLIVGTDTVNSKACDPFYFLKLGDPYLHGIQEYAMEVAPPDMLDDMMTYRSTFDWPIGLAMFHPRGIAKLAGVYAG